jgi:hypothetical protein
MNNSFVVFALVAGLTSLTVNARASLIISDNFTGTHGTDINGRQPDNVNLPGSSWSSTDYWGPSIRGNNFSIGADTEATISLLSNGLYSKPSIFTISAKFKMFTDTQGIGVGFGASPSLMDPSLRSQANYNNNFYGLVVNGSGAVSLVANSQSSQSVLGTVQWTGSSVFDPYSYYTLQYTVDSSLGKISAISLFSALDSAQSDFTALVQASNSTVFNSSTTSYAQLVGRGWNYGDTAYFKNLTVSGDAVPEPSALSLIAVGLGGLALVRRRK